MRKIILTIVLSTLSFSAIAEKSKSDIDSLNNSIYEGLIKDNFIKTNRITREGLISSCELEFQSTYRDIRALSGAVVVVAGSFSLMYDKEKYNIGSILKLVPNTIDLKSEQWTTLNPAYTNILINATSLEQYKRVEFQCDRGGKCIGYSDNDFKIVKLITATTPLDAEIIFSLVKGGADNRFKFSSLVSEQLSKQELIKFNECVFEELGQYMADLEKRQKPKN